MAEKKKKSLTENWGQVRHTATRTELQTRPDAGVHEVLAKAQKAEHALIVIQGEMLGRVFRLGNGKNIVGRHPSSTVHIQQRAVSGVHAQITVHEGSLILEDMQSTNGTFLNKDKILRPVVLQPGDLIKIASTVFKYTSSHLDAAISEELHLKVATDPMTGVYNKGYLNKVMGASIEIAKAGYPLSVVMFDLDHFKKINDTYGHMAGDYVLVETCRLLKNSGLRADDVLGRFGGEEFLLIMPDSDLKVAYSVAERIRRTIEEHDFIFDSKKMPVTTSVGVCTWIPAYTSAEKMLEAVDELLYQSKKKGRNCVSAPGKV